MIDQKTKILKMMKFFWKKRSLSLYELATTWNYGVKSKLSINTTVSKISDYKNYDNDFIRLGSKVNVQKVNDLFLHLYIERKPDNCDFFDRVLRAYNYFLKKQEFYNAKLVAKYLKSKYSL